MKLTIVITILALLFSGCTYPQEPELFKDAFDPVSNPAVAIPEDNPVQDSDSTEGSNTIHPIEATIYYGNDNADALLSEIIYLNELDTVSLISALIEVGILSEGTVVLSEELIGTCLHLDFNEAFRTRLCSMGTSGEYIIMGSLVNTFVDNFKDTVESIYLTVNGEVLESGHVIYDFEMFFFD